MSLFNVYKRQMGILSSYLKLLNQPKSSRLHTMLCVPQVKANSSSHFKLQRTAARANESTRVGTAYLLSCLNIYAMNDKLSTI